MLNLTYQVTHLPDLEIAEYQARYGENPAQQLLEMQQNFLYTLHNIAHQYALNCSLIYYYNSDEINQDKKLQIWVQINFEQDLSNQDLNQIRIIFQSSFWADFYQIKETSEIIDLTWAKYISFGIKREEKLLPTVKRDKSPSHYYLIQPFEPNQSVDRVNFCTKLEAYGKKALISIVIKPTNFNTNEQEGLENLLKALGQLTSYEVKTSEISGQMYEQPVDPVAERTFKLFEDLRENTQGHPLYEISLSVLAENQFNASLLLNEFWIESTAKPLYREIGLNSQDENFTIAIESVAKGTIFTQGIWANYWQNIPENSPLQKIARLHRLFTVEETNAYFRIVVPNPVVVFSGIPKETDLKSTNPQNSILLGWQFGKLQNQGQVPLKSLNKHVFICGVPGSGKTTAVLNLLFQLWTEHQIPFLVIEPAKTEYRSMLNCCYNEIALNQDNNPTTTSYIKARNVSKAIAKMQTDLQVFSLGNERVCPFRFNPFVFYGTTTLDEHISTLEACFKAAMPLFGPLPALLAEAIEQIYAQLNWQPQDTAEDGIKQDREFPNMEELYTGITKILETKQYSAEVMGDIKTALEVRIGGLLRRSVGSMLNTRQSVPDIANLLSQPVILEMDSLNEEQANLMTMFILATLRQYARVTRKSGSPLKHIVVIEEAHNIVGTDANKNGDEGASNPKAEATKYIVRMLAEMRALGQGIIIADQLPSAVSPEVIKNTNVKIAHRTVSGDDREILEQSMLLTTTQSEDLARSNPGDAYLFMEGLYKPVRIKEPNTKLIYGIEEPPSNEELVAIIKDQSFYQQAIITQKTIQQQKVDRYLQEIKPQLISINESSLTLLDASQSLLDISPKPDLNILSVFSEKLEELIPRLNQSLASNNNEINQIWLQMRQQGIYNQIKANSEIQELEEIINNYQQKIANLINLAIEKITQINQITTELADSIYHKATTTLTNNYHKIQVEITERQEQWEKIGAIASENQVKSLSNFCVNIKENLQKLESSISQHLSQSLASQYVGNTVQQNYDQSKQFGLNIVKQLDDLLQTVNGFKQQREILTQTFLKLQQYFSSYSEKADQVLLLIQQNSAKENIVSSYDYLETIRINFFQLLEEYDNSKTDKAIQLSLIQSQKIEDIIDSIESKDQEIKVAYKAKFN